MSEIVLYRVLRLTQTLLREGDKDNIHGGGITPAVERIATGKIKLGTMHPRDGCRPLYALLGQVLGDDLRMLVYTPSAYSGGTTVGLIPSGGRNRCGNHGLSPGECSRKNGDQDGPLTPLPIRPLSVVSLSGYLPRAPSFLYRSLGISHGFRICFDLQTGSAPRSCRRNMHSAYIRASGGRLRVPGPRVPGGPCSRSVSILPTG